MLGLTVIALLMVLTVNFPVIVTWTCGGLFALGVLFAVYLVVTRKVSLSWLVEEPKKFDLPDVDTWGLSDGGGEGKE